MIEYKKADNPKGFRNSSNFLGVLIFKTWKTWKISHKILQTIKNNSRLELDSIL